MGAPDAPLWALPAWFLGGLAVSEVSNWLDVRGLLLLAVLVVVSYAGLAWRRRRQSELVPELVEQEPPGKHGLVLPVSTIALMGALEEERRTLPAVLGRLHDGTPTSEDLALLERSNLESPMRTIEYHHNKGTLRDCWLITTEDVTYADGTTEHGSERAARILERWFFHRNPGARVKFHYGEQFRIHPRDYARMWLIVDELFERSPYRPENVIVDITPGTKPMSVALALACLESKRTMQYIVSGRHPLTGEVLGGARRQPILIDIEPYQYWRE
jgi:hypothetical protein